MSGKRAIMIRIICFLTFILSAVDVQSAVYECTNEEGKVTFTDRPCKGVDTTQKEMTKISDKAANFYGISSESNIKITPEMHKLLDLKHRGRTAKDICYRAYKDYRMMYTVNAWEERNKEKLSNITKLLNGSDSTAYQLNLISMMNKYENDFKRQSLNDRLKKCDDLMLELESD